MNDIDEISRRFKLILNVERWNILSMDYFYMKKEGIEKLLKVNLERGKYWKSVIYFSRDIYSKYSQWYKSNSYKLLIDTVRNKVCVHASSDCVHLYVENIRSSRALWTLPMRADSLVKPRIAPQALRSLLVLRIP